MIRASLSYGMLISILLGSLTSAEALRCGQRIIALGYTKVEVVDRCGEPTAIDQRYEDEIVGTLVDPVTKQSVLRTVSILVEEWTYNFGPHSLLYLLIFKENRLVKIDTRGYGN
jgi:Protein of unknown function (DUF2845)